MRISHEAIGFATCVDFTATDSTGSPTWPSAMWPNSCSSVQVDDGVLGGIDEIQERHGVADSQGQVRDRDRAPHGGL
jgi:hypothetical protein